MNRISIFLIIFFFIISPFNFSHGKSKITWQDKAFLAAEKGDLDALKLALNNGVDINALDRKYNASVLNKAITKGHTHLVKWLLKNNANPNLSGENISALHNAIFRGSLEQTQWLLEYGADIEVVDWHGNNPLMAASRTTNYELFKLLLSKTPDVNQQNRKGKTALYYACSNGSDDKVRLLLRHKADPNIAAKDGSTPLHVIVKWNMIGLIKARLLIQYGAAIDARNNDNLTPYELLKERKNPDEELLTILNPQKNVESK